MARDRLAAYRAQQQVSGDGAQSPALTSENHELRNINANANATSPNGMDSFYSELQILKDNLATYREYVTRISELHSRSMGNTDAGSIERDKSQLNDLTNTSRSLSNDIKKKIETLQRDRRPGTEGEIRSEQVALISRKFLEAIQNHQQIEQQYRTKFKQRVERQFKIVKPDATPEEIKVVVDEGGGEQIFTQALQSTTRYGAARMAYQEVQERQAEIQKIEYTLSELAQLFNEMSLLVEKEDEVIGGIEREAADTAVHAEQGLKHTEKAVKSARSARRKRWICFFLTLLILAILGVALGVGLGVGIPHKSN